MKHLKKFEGFRSTGVSKFSNFSVDELEDIVAEFKIVAESYKLKDLSNIENSEEESIERCIDNAESCYYINSARNSYIDIWYFGLEGEELIDDLKSFLERMKGYEFEIVNSWMYKHGFVLEHKENRNGVDYLHMSLVFYKPNQ